MPLCICEWVIFMHYLWMLGCVLQYVNRCCCMFESWCSKASKKRRHQCTTAESFSLMSISEAQLTSSLSLRSPFFPWIMRRDWSLMIHFFDKNYLVFALRDKTALDLTLNSGYTCQTNMHYLGEHLKCCQKAFLWCYISGWGLALLLFHHVVKPSLLIAKLGAHLQTLFNIQNS